MRQYPVNAISFTVEPIVTAGVCKHQDHQHADRHSQGEAEDVDEGKGPVFFDVAECNEDVVFDHSGSGFVMQ